MRGALVKHRILLERRLIHYRPTAFLYDKGENYELVMSTVYRSPERLSF